MPANPMRRYTVRKQSSGRTFSETYYVFDTVRGGRVSTEPGTREIAQAQADELNITAMVLDYDDDPRPFEVRLAEARETYQRG